jgi:hypothetical protein
MESNKVIELIAELIGSNPIDFKGENSEVFNENEEHPYIQVRLVNDDYTLIVINDYIFFEMEVKESSEVSRGKVVCPAMLKQNLTHEYYYILDKN